MADEQKVADEINVIATSMYSNSNRIFYNRSIDNRLTKKNLEDFLKNILFWRSYTGFSVGINIMLEIKK